MSDGYVVEIKASARRTNGAVGRAVNREGVRRRFDDREEAEAWADELTARGDRPVWIRDANPNDERDVDAYMMGRLRRSRNAGRPEEGDQSRVFGFRGGNRTGERPGRESNGRTRSRAVGSRSSRRNASGGE